MKLTSKGRYAVTATLYIALQEGQRAVNLSEISDKQKISLSYLEQLFAKLRRHGIVTSVRGPGGGYRLNRSPAEISVGMIIHAVSENIQVTKCLGKGNCKNGIECLTHHLWQDLSTQISHFLYGISLESLVKQHIEKHFKE